MVAQFPLTPYTWAMLTSKWPLSWRVLPGLALTLVVSPALTQCGGQTELVAIDTSSGGTSAGAGGSGNTSTLSHSGGEGTIGGGSGGTGTQCDSLTEAQCLSSQVCMGIYGSVTGDLSARTYIECQSSLRGCTAALTCATLPGGPPDNCMLFGSGCIPKGWFETLSCPLPGCPSIAP